MLPLPGRGPQPNPALPGPRPISFTSSQPAFVFEIAPDEFDLDVTFASGQLFRWSPVRPGCWEGPLGGALVRMERDGPSVAVWSAETALSRTDIARFLRLDTSLSDVRADIVERDRTMDALFDEYRGLRVLSQPPIECLLSFVCSSATSIARIRWSVDELCRRFGDGGAASFPDLLALAEAEPEALRVGGMEFRCRNLSGAARALRAVGGEGFLQGLRAMSYQDAAAALIALPGVGRKIADCALLFSLGFDCAFPLDTHTWRMVAERCGIGPLPRTDRGYRTASRLLREKYGPRAGWLQQYLFVHSLSLASRRSGR